MGNENIIEKKSFEFAKRIVFLCRYLREKKEFVISEQLLKSGTSIGANVVEATEAFSKKEFRYKMSIALKEARETDYWLRLLIETSIVKESRLLELLSLLNELISILVRIVKNAK